MGLCLSPALAFALAIPSRLIPGLDVAGRDGSCWLAYTQPRLTRPHVADQRLP